MTCGEDVRKSCAQGQLPAQKDTHQLWNVFAIFDFEASPLLWVDADAVGAPRTMLTIWGGIQVRKRCAQDQLPAQEDTHQLCDEFAIFDFEASPLLWVDADAVGAPRTMLTIWGGIQVWLTCSSQPGTRCIFLLRHALHVTSLWRQRVF